MPIPHLTATAPETTSAETQSQEVRITAQAGATARRLALLKLRYFEELTRTLFIRYSNLGADVLDKLITLCVNLFQAQHHFPRVTRQRP
jgi:hypothetical protein